MTRLMASASLEYLAAICLKLLSKDLGLLRPFMTCLMLPHSFPQIVNSTREIFRGTIQKFSLTWAILEGDEVNVASFEA